MLVTWLFQGLGLYRPTGSLSSSSKIAHNRPNSSHLINTSCIAHKQLNVLLLPALILEKQFQVMNVEKPFARMFRSVGEKVISESSVHCACRADSEK